ncbi:MAG: hypothetical protein LDLANPLL_01819 [Turneriella sp.]|nr:hypothetical protein [Turneriella sp.]
MATNKKEAAKENSKPLLKSFLISVTFSMIPLIAGIVLFSSQRSFWKNGAETDGKIVRIIKRTLCSYDRLSKDYSDCTEYHHPVFEYHVSGNRYENISDSTSEYSIGQSVRVIYAPEQPAKAELQLAREEDFPIWSIVLWIFSVAGFAYSGYLLNLYLYIWRKYFRYLKEKNSFDRE